MSMPPSEGDPADHRRIVVVGGCASGKTTLARRLSEKLGILHYELDRVAFGDGTGPPAQPRSRASFVDQLAAEDCWIADGDYVHWVEPLLARADLILFLDTSWPTATWRALKRELTARSAGEPRLGLWPALRACSRYHFDWRRASVTATGVLETRSTALAELARFAHKIRHCRSARDAVSHVATPPEFVMAARRPDLSMAHAAAAFVRQHDLDGELRFWYDAGDRHRGVYLLIAAAHCWESRLVGTDFPDWTDIATGRQRPIAVGRRIALMTSREAPLELARAWMQSFGLRLELIDQQVIGHASESFELAIIELTPSEDAIVLPLSLGEMIPIHGTIRRRAGGLQVVTPPKRWHYAAELEIESAIAETLANRMGYLHVKGSLEGGPVGIGVLARDRTSFLSRLALPAERETVDVYLPIERLGDATAVIVQAWDRRRSGELTIDAMEIVCAPGEA